MSVLPAGQSLSRFVPDLDELIDDARTYLSREPLTIGPRQMYGLAFLFGFAGGAFLLSCVILGAADGERLAVGIGLLLGGCVWLVWSLMMRGHSLVLHPSGVEMKYRDTTVWCPWALFNVEGHAFVPDVDNPRVGLTLPIASEAVPFVELRREGTPVAHGAEVKGRQWQFLASDTVVLPARYEVMAGELGELLLLLGRKLGREFPKGAPPPQAFGLAALDELPAAPNAGGWITMPLTRLAFPPYCCECGEETSRTMNFTLASRSDAMLGMMIPAGQAVELPIPVCANCQRAVRTRQQVGGIRGMQGGAIVFGVLTLLLAWNAGLQNALLFVIGIAGAAAGGLIGFLFGTYASRRLPAEVRRFSPSRGTLSLRFRQPEYAARVLAAMRDRVRRDRSP